MAGMAGAKRRMDSHTPLNQSVLRETAENFDNAEAEAFRTREDMEASRILFM